MKREEWKAAHRLARIARHRQVEGSGAMLGTTLEQDVRRLARHAAIEAMARRPAANRPPPAPRTRHVAAAALLVALAMILGVLARQAAGPDLKAGVIEADAPATVQVAPPDSLPQTQPT